MSLGFLANKIGMSRYHLGKGRFVPVTLIRIEDCYVSGVRSYAKEGFSVAAISSGAVANQSRVAKPQRGIFLKNNLPVLKKTKGFKFFGDEKCEVGQKFSVENIELGDLFDIEGVSSGKGFAGVMKRHNFRGLEASHGVSVSHRSHGSIGQCQDPGKVFKGKKMAGQMGATKITVKNLEVVYRDCENGVIGVKGAVPGHKGGDLILRKS